MGVGEGRITTGGVGIGVGEGLGDGIGDGLGDGLGLGVGSGISSGVGGVPTITGGGVDGASGFRNRIRISGDISGDIVGGGGRVVMMVVEPEVLTAGGTETGPRGNELSL